MIRLIKNRKISWVIRGILISIPILFILNWQYLKMQRIRENKKDKVNIKKIFKRLANKGILEIPEKGMNKQLKSLIRILVIIGVLFTLSIFIPTSHPVTTASRRSYCLSNMKLIGSCLGMYANNNRSPTRKLFSSEEYACFPEISGNRGFLRIYKDGLENKKVYKCLGDGKSQKTFWEKTFGNSPEPGNSEFKSDYIYLGGFAKQENPAVPILFDKIGNHEDYCNVMFSDGATENYELKDNSYDELLNEINKKKNYSQQTIDRIKASLKQALKNNKADSEKTESSP